MLLVNQFETVGTKNWIKKLNFRQRVFHENVCTQDRY